MANKFFVQCELEKTTDKKSIKRLVSWIPVDHAKLGKTLRLKEDSGKWTGNWKVKTVGTIKLLESDLPDSRRAVRNHRKYTGDSNPKRETYTNGNN